MSKKRNLMYVTAGTVLTGIGLARLAKQGKKDKETNGIDHVLKQIKAPKFPDREFNVIHYGADNKGIELSTNAIQSAIDDAHRLKGGRVLIPEGTFLTGALELKSNVELHLHENAYVTFSQDTRDYLPLVLTRYEGIELYNYSPLIYAHHAENIAITGAGTLDGRGMNTTGGLGSMEQMVNPLKIGIVSFFLKWLKKEYQWKKECLAKAII